MIKKWLPSRRDREDFVYRPQTKALYYAELIDAWRVVPRTILIAYAYLVYWIVDWFLVMENPTTQQAALVTTVTGTVAAVIGLYQHTGRKWGPHGAMGMIGRNTIPVMPMPTYGHGHPGGGGRDYPRGGTAATGEHYGDEE